MLPKTNSVQQVEQKVIINHIEVANDEKINFFKMYILNQFLSRWNYLKVQLNKQTVTEDKDIVLFSTLIFL